MRARGEGAAGKRWGRKPSRARARRQSAAPPPRFRARQKKEERDPTRFGQLPSFGNAPGSGVGSTGFDSTNRGMRNAGSATSSGTSSGIGSESWSGLKSATKPESKPRNKPGTGAQSKATGSPAGKPKQPTKPGGANGTGAQAGGAAGANSAGAKADAAQGSVAGNGADAASPRLLQPAVAPLSGRLRQFRPGAPPASPEAETATVATTPPLWRPIPDPKPFDPLGVQVGAFNFRPAVEYLRGYDTNPARLGLPPISASWFNLYAPELLVNSNWSRHELTANLRGAFTSFDTAHRLDRPTVDGRINGRIDVTSHTRVDLEGRFILATDYPGSPNIQADLAHLPIYTTLGGSAGIGQRFNRFEVTLKGGVDRTEYQKSVFINGQTESNSDRDYNQYSTALRAAYELSPELRPFAEVTANKRVHDLPVDRFALDRNSEGFSAKAGSSFNLARTLTGEIAMGYVNQMYLAPLPNLGGFLVESSLVWSASALTTAKLFATTTITESPLLLVSGVFSRQVGIEVNHAFRRFLIGTAKFGFARDEYAGAIRKDNRFLASAALSYLLSREVELKGEMRQEWQRSNIPGANYVASIWLLGLRLQR
jgi:hypothetical protein